MSASNDVTSGASLSLTKPYMAAAKMSNVTIALKVIVSSEMSNMW